MNKENLVYGYSLRRHRNMSLSYGQTGDSLDNRKDFLGGLGINWQDLVCAKQTHSNNVRYVDDKDKGRGALSYHSSIDDTDALITDKRNLPLAVFTADCLSIFLYDPLLPAVGLVHAGWRSTKDSILANAILMMKEKFGTKPENLYASFGPAIKGCCYEVEGKFGEYFSYGLTERKGRHYLDLGEANRKQLLNSGVRDANIFDPRICTSCLTEDFFSFRKEGKECGRMISVIMLK